MGISWKKKKKGLVGYVRGIDELSAKFYATGHLLRRPSVQRVYNTSASCFVCSIPGTSWPGRFMFPVCGPFSVGDWTDWRRRWLLRWGLFWARTSFGRCGDSTCCLGKTAESLESLCKTIVSYAQISTLIGGRGISYAWNFSYDALTIWYNPSGSTISRSLHVSASREIASRFSWSPVFARVSWQDSPIPTLYILRPRIASLLVGSENKVLGALFSSIPGGSPVLSAIGLCCRSDTRRNCLTVEGLLPKVMSTPRGCFIPLDLRFVFDRLIEGDRSVDAGLLRIVEFAIGFGWCAVVSRSRFSISSDVSLISSAGSNFFMRFCVFFAIVPGFTVSNTHPSSSTLCVSVFLQHVNKDKLEEGNLWSYLTLIPRNIWSCLICLCLLPIPVAGW